MEPNRESASPASPGEATPARQAFPDRGAPAAGKDPEAAQPRILRILEGFLVLGSLALLWPLFLGVEHRVLSLLATLSILLLSASLLMKILRLHRRRQARLLDPARQLRQQRGIPVGRRLSRDSGEDSTRGE